MIYVSTDTTEEIDSSMFSTLRSQIENHLTTNNLVSSLNYIVTTKGVPLKVNRGDTTSILSPSSSVESEIACLLGTYAAYIGSGGWVSSPYYYYHSVSFTRPQFGFYLVTRLDAYTVQQVYDMIDRSGLQVNVSPTACYVLDQDPAWNTPFPHPLNTNLATARTILEAKGKTVYFDEDTTYQTWNNNVIGYVSWGSNDHYADNLLGERVATLVDEARQAGYYSEQFDATGLASGLYFYRIQSNSSSSESFVATKKLLLLR